MKKAATCLFDVSVWVLVGWLLLYIPQIEMRVEEYPFDQPATREQPAQAQVGLPPTTARPEPIEQFLNLEKCFHLPREQCPKAGCRSIANVGIFCCDLDNQKLKEVLTPLLLANTTTKYLHVLNASLSELDVSAAMFKRLASMAFTDGRIGKISGQFPKNSAMACLNISSNNLTSAKLQPPTERPYAYLFNLTVLDASANNLTLFPLTVHSNRNISVDLSGNNYIPCKEFQRAMESIKVNFLHYNATYCVFYLRVGIWIEEMQIVPIDHLRVQRELNHSCNEIRPANINCTCVAERLLSGAEVTRLVAVDCTNRHLKELPTNLPPNTVKLDVSHNNITSLDALSSEPSYSELRQLFLEYNDLTNILELEGTKFIDTFDLFSVAYNKLKSIPIYVVSNRFDSNWPKLSIAGNSIHCDCNTEKMLKPWLLEFSKNIPDYKKLMCADLGAVVDLVESQVCHTPRDWTDYIYYIIGLEVLILVLLVSKVSYDYWVFKTAGYLPWPANKMPRLPCDWLCE